MKSIWKVFSVLLPYEKSYPYTYHSSYTWRQGESTCVWEYKLFLVLTAALSEPPPSHYTLPFSPTLKARVCSSDDTHLFPISTPVLLSTPVSPAPPRPAQPSCDWLQREALWSPVLSLLPSSHENSVSGSVSGVLTVLGLPPGLQAVVGEGRDHVLDGVADVVVVLVVHLAGVAHETFLLLLMDTEHREC